MIALPNLLFASALLFAIGAFTRKLFAVYITGIFLLAAWQVTQQIVGQLDKLTLASLIDPFALTTTNTMIRYWSVAEKNARLVPFSGLLLQNRLLWIAIALALFGLVMVLFRLRLQHGGRGRTQSKASAAIVKPTAYPTPVVHLALRHAVVAPSVLRAEPFPLPVDHPRSAVSRDLGHLRHQSHGRRVVHGAPRRISDLAGDVGDRARRGEQRVHLRRAARDALRR